MTFFIIKNIGIAKIIPIIPTNDPKIKHDRIMLMNYILSVLLYIFGSIK